TSHPRGHRIPVAVGSSLEEGLLNEQWVGHLSPLGRERVQRRRRVWSPAGHDGIAPSTDESCLCRGCEAGYILLPDPARGSYVAPPGGGVRERKEVGVCARRWDESVSSVVAAFGRLPVTMA